MHMIDSPWPENLQVLHIWQDRCMLLEYIDQLDEPDQEKSQNIPSFNT